MAALKSGQLNADCMTSAIVGGKINTKPLMNHGPILSYFLLSTALRTARVTAGW
jgi:hypothetical protein